MTLTKGAGSNQSYYSNGIRSLKIQDTESPGEKSYLRKNGKHPPPPPKKKTMLIHILQKSDFETPQRGSQDFRFG